MVSTLPLEIHRKIKLLELNTRRLVNDIFSGEYKSSFKGQGMTFSEFREYVPGDDVRNISWTLTAKVGKAHVKIFEEEREQTLMLAVDISGSSNYGTGEYLKGEVMVHLAALLAFSAIKNNDKVGLLLFTNQVELFVPPKKGRGQVHRILRDLYYFKPKSRGTCLSIPLDYLSGVLKKNTTVFVMSDFMDKNCHRSFRLLARKHEVIGVVVEDSSEYKIPDMGVVDLHDGETGELLTVDTSSSSFRKSFEDLSKKRRLQRDRELKKSLVDCINILDGEDFVDPLIAYFKKRRARG